MPLFRCTYIFKNIAIFLIFEFTDSMIEVLHIEVVIQNYLAIFYYVIFTSYVVYCLNYILNNILAVVMFSEANDKCKCSN